MILLALVTTSCHNCKPVKKYIQNHHIDVDEIVIMDETHEAFGKNVGYWKCTTAPTVLLIDNGEEVGRAHDVEELKELLNNNQKND